MILPQKIKGRHKIRDGGIVLYFKKYDYDFIDLAEKFKLTERRIRQILSVNHAFIPIDKDWEKEKRINWIKRQIKQIGNSKKDSADLLRQLREEIEDIKNGETSIHIYPNKTFIFKDLKNEDDSERTTDNSNALESTEGNRIESKV